MTRARSLILTTLAREPHARHRRVDDGCRPPPVRRAGRRTVRIALDYSANVNYLGIYVAQEKVWFARQHITLKIIPYANTPAETLIDSGATTSASAIPRTSSSIARRGSATGRSPRSHAQNTTGLAVLASSKYTRPSQLDGTLYGGFGIASDEPLVTAILRGDGVAKPSFKQVVLNTDVFDALSKGRIQYTAVFGGIDDVTAGLQGIRLRLFPYRRYLGAAGNYPNVVFVASDSTIAKRRRAAAHADGARPGLRVLREAPGGGGEDPDRRQPDRARQERQDRDRDRQRHRPHLPGRGRSLGPDLGERLHRAREDARGRRARQGALPRRATFHERALLPAA